MHNLNHGFATRPSLSPLTELISNSRADPVAAGVHAANLARLQRGIPKVANLLSPERDAGHRMLQLTSQPGRHLSVYARRIPVSGRSLALVLRYNI